MTRRDVWNTVKVERGPESWFMPYDDLAADADLCQAITYEKKMRCTRYPGVDKIPADGAVPGPA